MMSNHEEQNNDRGLIELELASLYVPGGPHGVTLRLEIRHGSGQGTLVIDPNNCSLNPWGDREGCTRIAPRTINVQTVRMRTEDPANHGRVLHVMSSEAFERESANLIEYPKADLWYIVHRRRSGDSWVIPLFEAKLFEADPAGTIAMRYGVPMREAMVRGDLEEMKLEAEVVRGALAELDLRGGRRGRARLADAHLAEVKAVFAELEEAIAKAGA